MTGSVHLPCFWGYPEGMQIVTFYPALWVPEVWIMSYYVVMSYFICTLISERSSTLGLFWTVLLWTRVQVAILSNLGFHSGLEKVPSDNVRLVSPCQHSLVSKVVPEARLMISSSPHEILHYALPLKMKIVWKGKEQQQPRGCTPINIWLL